MTTMAPTAVEFEPFCVTVDIPLAAFFYVLVVASLVTILASFVLGRYGVPVSITQILSGLVLLPSLTSFSTSFKDALVVNMGSVMFKSHIQIGVIFQMFLIGVQTDLTTLFRTGKRELVIGFSAVVVPLLLSIPTAVLVAAMLDYDSSVAHSLPVVASLESMSAFPVIAGFLIELNIMNSEFSSVAISSSMVSGLFSFALIIMVSILTSNGIGGSVLEFLSRAFVYVFVFVAVWYVLQPLTKAMIRWIPEKEKVKETYIGVVVVLVVLLFFICDIGQIQNLFGPFLFGIVIPNGPPLGAAMVEMLDFISTWLYMPTYYFDHGLYTLEVTGLTPTHALAIGVVILVSFAGKFFGAFLPAIYYNLSYRDATLLGLTLNVQGFLELSAFTYLRQMEVIDGESYLIMSYALVFVTVLSAPMISYLYKSSVKYELHQTRNIQHADAKAQLRILTCMYEQQNVPSAIHFLKACNPTKETPIHASVVHFVELLGRAIPKVISHKQLGKSSPATAVSDRIINVFKQYEENDRRAISINPYTVITSYTSLHNDLCTIAHQKMTSLMVLPFHVEVASGVVNLGIRTVNCNVLETAPCSVGILIDRGVFGGVKYVYENWASYSVAVLFLGDADDREALALGEKMCAVPTVELTVIRCLKSYNEGHDMIERGLDDEMISNFRSRTRHNRSVKYVEEDVKDGLEFMKVIEEMKDKYELIILGRRHDKNSPLILDLTDWNKCSELGTIGDIFITSNHGGKATVMVVQQHIKERQDFDKNVELLTRSYSYDC